MVRSLNTITLRTTRESCTTHSPYMLRLHSQSVTIVQCHLLDPQSLLPFLCSPVEADSDFDEVDGTSELPLQPSDGQKGMRGKSAEQTALQHAATQLKIATAEAEVCVQGLTASLPSTPHSLPPLHTSQPPSPPPLTASLPSIAHTLPPLHNSHPPSPPHLTASLPSTRNHCQTECDRN